MAGSPQIKAEWMAGWHARDEEVAAKDRRIEELEREKAFALKEWGKAAKVADQLMPLQAQIDRVRELREAAGNLAWAAEVELDKSNRTREFVYQHREKVRHWIKTVRELLAALGEPATAKIVHAGPLKMKPIDEGEPAAPRCIGYPKCDGNLVAEPHSEECPLYRSESAATPERKQKP
jgi:phosphoribosyl-AMP cyclohydrolase